MTLPMLYTLNELSPREKIREIIEAAKDKHNARNRLKNLQNFFGFLMVVDGATDTYKEIAKLKDRDLLLRVIDVSQNVIEGMRAMGYIGSLKGANEILKLTPIMLRNELLKAWLFGAGWANNIPLIDYICNRFSANSSFAAIGAAYGGHLETVLKYISQDTELLSLHYAALNGHKNIALQILSQTQNEKKSLLIQQWITARVERGDSFKVNKRALAYIDEADIADAANLGLFKQNSQILLTQKIEKQNLFELEDLHENLYELLQILLLSGDAEGFIKLVLKCKKDLNPHEICIDERASSIQQLAFQYTLNVDREEINSIEIVVEYANRRGFFSSKGMIMYFIDRYLKNNDDSYTVLQYCYQKRYIKQDPQHYIDYYQSRMKIFLKLHWLILWVNTTATIRTWLLTSKLEELYNRILLPYLLPDLKENEVVDFHNAVKSTVFGK